MRDSSWMDTRALACENVPRPFLPRKAWKAVGKGRRGRGCGMGPSPFGASRAAGAMGRGFHPRPSPPACTEAGQGRVNPKRLHTLGGGVRAHDRPKKSRNCPAPLGSPFPRTDRRGKLHGPRPVRGPEGAGRVTREGPRAGKTSLSNKHKMVRVDFPRCTTGASSSCHQGKDSPRAKGPKGASS